MRIQNLTHWNTTDLRKIFTRAMQEVDKTEKNPKRRLQVLFAYAHQLRGISGRANYWGTIRINIPKDTDFEDIDRKIRLVHVSAHEYVHIVSGNNYIDRRDYRNDWTARLNYDWVKDYEIRKKEITEKPKIDIQKIRYERAMKNYHQAETRLKRAKTLLNKWKKKMKYYEVVFANRPK